MILSEALEGVVRGQYAWKVIDHKILHVGIWWPTLHKDDKEFCKTCDVCQRVENPSRRYEMPLVSQVTFQSFDKWEVDFIGPINPPTKRVRERYIITAIDYLT
jgi:hypothetical protein